MSILIFGTQQISNVVILWYVQYQVHNRCSMKVRALTTA